MIESIGEFKLRHFISKLTIGIELYNIHTFDYSLMSGIEGLVFFCIFRGFLFLFSYSCIMLSYRMSSPKLNCIVLYHKKPFI